MKDNKPQFLWALQEKGDSYECKLLKNHRPLACDVYHNYMNQNNIKSEEMISFDIQNGGSLSCTIHHLRQDSYGWRVHYIDNITNVQNFWFCIIRKYNVEELQPNFTNWLKRCKETIEFGIDKPKMDITDCPVFENYCHLHESRLDENIRSKESQVQDNERKLLRLNNKHDTPTYSQYKKDEINSLSEKINALVIEQGKLNAEHKMQTPDQFERKHSHYNKHRAKNIVYSLKDKQYMLDILHLQCQQQEIIIRYFEEKNAQHWRETDDPTLRIKNEQISNLRSELAQEKDILRIRNQEYQSQIDNNRALQNEILGWKCFCTFLSLLLCLKLYFN